MTSVSKRIADFSLVFALSILPVGGIAWADGAGEPIEDLQAHIGDYEKEIAMMVDTADAIVADYAAGEAVADQVDALVGEWEHVEFHEAVETEAMALYSPIWVALGGLREAVGQSGAEADVRMWRHRLEVALYEGIGALKLAAVRANSATGGASSQNTAQASETDDRPTIAIIQDDLERALDAYRDDDVTAAKELVHETYMQRFEGIEGDLIERDAALVTQLEEDFNATLPLLMDRGASADEVDARIEAMNTKLDRAQTLLDEAGQDKSSVF